MSSFSWLFTLLPSSAPSLLLVGLVGRQLGLRVGLQVVQTVTCSHLGSPSAQGLFQDGDVVIGGLFSLYHKTPSTAHDFTELPDYKPCTRLNWTALLTVKTVCICLTHMLILLLKRYRDVAFPMMIHIDYLYYLQITIKHLNTFWQIFLSTLSFSSSFQSAKSPVTVHICYDVCTGRNQS